MKNYENIYNNIEYIKANDSGLETKIKESTIFFSNNNYKITT